MNIERRVLTVENQHLVVEQKIMPGALVRQTLEKRMKKVTKEQGFLARRSAALP